MRVLQITAFSGWGCTGRIALGIHNELVKSGYESVIAWGRKNTAPENVKTIKIGNSVDQKLHGLYTRITDKCGWGSKRVTKNFLEKLDEYKPDLIQLHIMHGYYINLELLFTYIRKHRIPVVWTFHDCWAFTGHCPYFDLVQCEKWKQGCYNCIQKKHHPTSWLMDNSKRNWKKKKELFTALENLTVVTPSKWLAGLVKQSFLKDCSINVINNGINLNDFYSIKSDVNERLNTDGRKIVLGVSSTWVKSKGLDDFIALAKILSKKFVIVLVGLTKEQKAQLPDNMIGIERTDSIMELAVLYSAASVFVNPTYEDNYPTTNIEALACGTPVITYNTGGSIEAAGDRYGKVIQQGDINELATYIESEKWKQFTAEQCMKAAKEYDEKERFTEYVSLYEDILQKDENLKHCVLYETRTKI